MTYCSICNDRETTLTENVRAEYAPNVKLEEKISKVQGSIIIKFLIGYNKAEQ